MQETSMTVAQLIMKLQGMPDMADLNVVVRDGRGKWQDAELVSYNRKDNRFYIEEAIGFPDLVTK